MRLSMNPIMHENYNIPKVSSNDIALLKLAEEVNMTSYTPVCLPPFNNDYEDKVGNAYGKNSSNKRNQLPQL